MEISEIKKIKSEQLSKRDVEIIEFVIENLHVNEQGKIDMTKLLLTPKGKGYASFKIFDQ